MTIVSESLQRSTLFEQRLAAIVAELRQTDDARIVQTPHQAMPGIGDREAVGYLHGFQAALDAVERMGGVDVQ